MQQVIDPVQVVVEAVAEQFGVKPEAIRQEKRGPERIYIARNAAYAILRHEFKYSWHEIGRAFGRTHSTALRGAQHNRHRSLHRRDHWQRVANATLQAATILRGDIATALRF